MSIWPYATVAGIPIPVALRGCKDNEMENQRNWRRFVQDIRELLGFGRCLRIVSTKSTPPTKQTILSAPRWEHRRLSREYTPFAVNYFDAYRRRRGWHCHRHLAGNAAWSATQRIAANRLERRLTRRRPASHLSCGWCPSATPRGSPREVRVPPLSEGK